MGLTDRLQSVPTWGWAAGGIFVVLLAFMATRGSGGTRATSPEIPATDVNDILEQLQDALNNLPENPAPAPTTPSTPTPEKKSLWGSDLSKWYQNFDSYSAKRLFDKYKIDYGTTINKTDLRALFRKIGYDYDRYIEPKDLKAIGIVEKSNSQVS